MAHAKGLDAARPFSVWRGYSAWRLLNSPVVSHERAQRQRSDAIRHVAHAGAESLVLVRSRDAHLNDLQDCEPVLPRQAWMATDDCPARSRSVLLFDCA